MMLSGRADDRQREAILADGHGLVSACPGAGKTRVLALRSAHLLTHNPKGRILAVTFTRDAARSLRTRILDEAGADYAGRVASGTVPALALNPLERQDTANGFRIASPNDQHMLLTQAWEIAAHRAAFSFDPFADARAAIESIKASTDPPPSPTTAPAGG